LVEIEAFYVGNLSSRTDCNATYDLYVQSEEMSKVRRNIANDDPDDPVVRELTEYQREHWQ